MCIYEQDTKYLWSHLWLGGLSTDEANTNDNGDNADPTAGLQHTTDNSWMHGLIGIYAKWVKKPIRFDSLILVIDVCACIS